MASRDGGLVSLASIDRMLRKAGAERVSEEAKKELRKKVEDYGKEVGRKAVSLAKHAGRKTVKPKDIKLATK